MEGFDELLVVFEGLDVVGGGLLGIREIGGGVFAAEAAAASVSTVKIARVGSTVPASISRASAPCDPTHLATPSRSPSR